MNAKEILELVRAGFTKEDILKMSSDQASDIGESPAVKDQDETPAEGGKADEVAESEDPGTIKKKEASSEKSLESTPQFDRMISKMDEMIKTMQASNREAVENTLSSQQPDFMKAAEEFFGGKTNGYDN